jgi:peptidase E
VSTRAATSTVHLIGGGPGALLATRRHLKQAITACGVKKPLVAYVGAASNDHLGFQKMVSALFVGTGARVAGVNLARKNARVSTARQLLADCDVVFMSGGDVDHGMRILDDRGVSDDLRGLAAAGKPFIGISAGAIMTGQGWVRFPDDDETRAEPFACLGIAPLHMDAHSEDDGWSELRLLVQLLARAADGALGYGVPAKGCLRVDLGGKSPTLTAMGAPIARIAAKNGAVVDQTPLAPPAAR